MVGWGRECIKQGENVVVLGWTIDPHTRSFTVIEARRRFYFEVRTRVIGLLRCVVYTECPKLEFVKRCTQISMTIDGM